MRKPKRGGLRGLRMDNLEGVWVKPQVVTFSIIANEIFTHANPRILAGALLS